MFSQIDRALARAAGIQSDRQRGQSSLFGTLEEKATPGFGGAEADKNLPEWPQHELLAYEKELLGFYVTGHPLTPYVPLLKRYALATTSQLAGLPNRSMTRIGGLVATVQNGVSKKSGKPYSMVTLEDLEGTVQILCMNENFEKFRPLLQVNKAVLVTGEVNVGDERPKIFPQEMMALEDAPKKFTKQVHFRLQTAHVQPAQLESVRDLVAGHPGKCPLFLCFMQPAGEVYFMQANDRFAVTPSLNLQQEADSRFGEGTYYAKVDTTLPERVSRWPKKGASNGGSNGED
jgi:DNA polymerase-3 subunit alpha